MEAHNPGPGIFISEHSKAKNGTPPSWIRITDEDHKTYYERIQAEARTLDTKVIFRNSENSPLGLLKQTTIKGVILPRWFLNGTPPHWTIVECEAYLIHRAM